MSESTSTRTDRMPRTEPHPEAAAPEAAESGSAPEAQTPAPPAGHASPEAETAPERATGRKRRRVLRAVGRWTAAVTVFGVLGTGVAYAIAGQERTDLPGLATRDDGRWDYPEVSLPPLPSGSPRPFAEGNVGNIHHADLRDLLLPAPRGAAADEDLPGIKGEWVSTEEFTQLFAEDDRAGLELRLVDDAVRHIAARGWTMPDGTRTRVYLLRFNGAPTAYQFHTEAISDGLETFATVTGAHATEVDESWPDEAGVPDVMRYAYDEPKPRGETHVRQAYLTAGDTVAVVVQSRKGTAHTVPFQQTVILQSQLLG